MSGYCVVAGTQVFLSVIQNLVSNQCSAFDSTTWLPEDFGPYLREEDQFDFIIVGGGTAGCVLANRLTEIGAWRVLLLESGGYPSALSEIPLMFPALYGGDESWKYTSEPSTQSCLGFKNGRCITGKGKMLGGTSSLNFMDYARGNRRDFDSWEALGNTNWGWNSTFKYFTKSSNIQQVSAVEPQSHFPLLINAYKELGLYHNDVTRDIGIYENLLITENGKRSSTAKSYLRPIKNRSNLYVALNAHVMKIDFTSLTATGVQVRIGQRNLTLTARNEVILSAGAFNSPQLLMLSGVGITADLVKLKIKLVKHLKVGENLQDQLITLGLMIKLNESPNIRKTAFGNAEDLSLYFNEFKGPLTSNTMNLNPYINTKNNSTYPNIYGTFPSFVKNDTLLLPGILEAIQLNDQSKTSLFEINKDNYLMGAMFTVLKPVSRGSVVLKTSNPFDAPAIHYNYLSDTKNEDINLYLEAIEHLKSLLKTQAMRDLNAQLVNFNIPGCTSFTFDTPDYWKCNLRNLGSTMYRPAGTCKMGPTSDVNAVVNPRLLVHNLKQLRVVDSSIMPTLVSANSHIPTIIIAEKAADMIKEDWER